VGENDELTRYIIELTLAESVDQRDNSSTEEASSPSSHVQRPQRPHVQLSQLWAGMHTHSTATERGLDKKIAAHEDQARSQTQGKLQEAQLRQQAEAVTRP